MTDTKPELKSCPFCCGKIFLSEDDEPQFYFTCGTCLISFNICAEGGREPSKEEAYRKMNTRPNATGEKTVINDTELAEACEILSSEEIKLSHKQQEAIETLINHAVKGEKVAEVTVEEFNRVLDERKTPYPRNGFYAGISVTIAECLMTNYPNGLKIIDGGV